MKPTSHHYIALTVSALILLLSIGLYFFIDIQVKTQAAQTTDALAAVASKEALEGQERSIVASLASTSDSRALAGTYLISQGQTVSFIETVEGIGKKTGSTVTIASISADDLTSAPVGKVGHLQAHITINGSWPSVMRALHGIEGLPYALSIDSVNVHTLGEGLWSIDCNIAALTIK